MTFWPDVSAGFTGTSGGCGAPKNRGGCCHSRSDRPAWVEVDLAAIGHNLQELRRLVGPRVRIMAVVKGNAYGHGAVEVARVAAGSGADQLAVAILQEALQLRQAQVACPILVLGCALPDQAFCIVSNSITQAISTLQMGVALSTAACSLGKTAYAHVKVDTGMGRLGVPVREAVQLVSELQKLPNLGITGIFTQLACADEQDDVFSLTQLARFREMLQGLASYGANVGTIHAANSASIVRYPESHFDMVRAGLVMYGLPPYPGALGNMALRPCLSLKARVVQVRLFRRGSAIGYGRTYEVNKDTVLAVVPIGYGDGLPRALSSRGYVLVRGKRAPIVGRVCMDQLTIDVGDIGDVEPGEVVTIIGDSKSECISACEVADMAGTIQNEIVSSLTDRLPRLYVGK